MRYDRTYERVRGAQDRRSALRELTDHELVQALAAASKEHDPYLANVLATEAQNRVGQKEMILHRMGDGVFVIDAQGGVLMANPQVGRLLDRRAEDMLGEDMHALTACACEEEDDRSREACPILRAARRGEALACVARYRRADGTDALVEINASPIERDGEPSGAVIVLRDVAERRRTEEALQRLAAMVRSSHDAIVGIMPEGVITDWNPAAERIFGWRAHEVVGRHVRLLVPPGEEGDLERNLRRVASGETFGPYETRRLRKDGTLVDVSLTASPVRQEGRVVGVVAVLRDVTERKRLEEDLARLAAREREGRREAERQASTWIPALAWGSGVGVGLALAVLLLLVLVPGATPDMLQFVLVLGVLLVGLAVGFRVARSHRRA